MNRFLRTRFAAAMGGSRQQRNLPWLRHATVLAVLAFVMPYAACKRGDPIEMLGPQPTPAALQKYWALPDFALMERSGKEVRLADLKGKVWVADFIYTTCPGPCPMLTSRLGDVQKALGNEPDLQLVSMTTDPEKDTPEVLEAYAERFKAGDHWWFLTGRKETIFSLARDGFKLPIAEAGADGPAIVHSTRLVLVDKTGTVRGFYEGAGESGPNSLVDDIRRLLEEK